MCKSRVVLAPGELSEIEVCFCFKVFCLVCCPPQIIQDVENLQHEAVTAQAEVTVFQASCIKHRMCV